MTKVRSGLSSMALLFLGASYLASGAQLDVANLAQASLEAELNLDQMLQTTLQSKEASKL